MKKILQFILNTLWRIQFKKVPYNGKPIYGHHCRECVAGKRFFCGDFYCPLEKLYTRKFEWRFEWMWYQKMLENGAHKITA